MYSNQNTHYESIQDTTIYYNILKTLEKNVYVRLKIWHCFKSNSKNVWRWTINDKNIKNILVLEIKYS